MGEKDIRAKLEQLCAELERMRAVGRHVALPVVVGASMLWAACGDDETIDDGSGASGGAYGVGGWTTSSGSGGVYGVPGGFGGTGGQGGDVGGQGGDVGGQGGDVGGGGGSGGNGGAGG